MNENYRKLCVYKGRHIEKVDHDFKCFKLETLNAFYYTHKKINSLSLLFSSLNKSVNEWMKKLRSCAFMLYGWEKKGKTLVIEFNWSKLKFLY